MFHPRYMFHALAAPLLIETQEALDALPADEWADSPPAAQELAARKAELIALVEDEVTKAVFATGQAQLESARLAAALKDHAAREVTLAMTTPQVPETGDDVAPTTTISVAPVTSDLTPQERANAEMEATIAALMAGNK